jgi:hypothetical protein
LKLRLGQQLLLELRHAFLCGHKRLRSCSAMSRQHVPVQVGVDQNELVAFQTEQAQGVSGVRVGAKSTGMRMLAMAILLPADLMGQCP